MKLGYLSEQDALRVVKEPMDAMGITFEKAGKVPEKIVTLSSGHPNLVQAICHMLINRVNECGDRVVWAHDLAIVRESDQFRDFVVEVVWGDASKVGRLITMLMAHKSAFAADDVRTALQARGYEISQARLDEALDDLMLLSVLHRRGEQYTFTAQAFIAIMSDPRFTGSFSEALLEELQDEEPWSFAGQGQNPAQPPQSRSDEVE